MLHQCSFRISIRGPGIWNNLVGSTEKEIQSSSHFKTKMKRKLLFLKMESPFSNAFAFKKFHSRKHLLMVTTYYDYSI